MNEDGCVMSIGGMARHNTEENDKVMLMAEVVGGNHVTARKTDVDDAENGVRMDVSEDNDVYLDVSEGSGIKIDVLMGKLIMS